MKSLLELNLEGESRGICNVRTLEDDGRKFATLDFCKSKLRALSAAQSAFIYELVDLLILICSYLFKFVHLKVLREARGEVSTGVGRFSSAGSEKSCCCAAAAGAAAAKGTGSWERQIKEFLVERTALVKSKKQELERTGVWVARVYVHRAACMQAGVYVHPPFQRGPASKRAGNSNKVFNCGLEKR